MKKWSETSSANTDRQIGKSVTMEDIGRIAGVSQVTVSRALREPHKVSARTMERINQAIRETGFVPNALAGALASNKSMLISVLVPSITNIVYATMVRSLSAELRAHGYQILLSETGFDLAEEERLIATHLSRRPDAMALTGNRHTPDSRKMLESAGIPVVELWDVSQNPIGACVGFSHALAARSAADFAVESGYQQAGLATAEDERAQRRAAAFSDQFLKRTGNAVAHEFTSRTATIENGRAALAAIVDSGFKSGIIFCSSDVMAHGILIEAAKRGLSVPGDIAVMGFGDQDFAAHVEPPLTTVRVDRKRLGSEGAKVLLAALNNTAEATGSIDLGFEVIKRASA